LVTSESQIEATSSIDVFQLATANGHLTSTISRASGSSTRKSAPDTPSTSGMLQIASNCMTVSPKNRASSTMSIRLAEATRQHLQDQRSGVRTDLQEITRIREEQRAKEQDLRAAREERAALQEGSSAPRTSAWVRRAPVRFEDMRFGRNSWRSQSLETTSFLSFIRAQNNLQS